MKNKIVLIIVAFVGLIGFIALVLFDKESYALSDNEKRDWNIYFSNLETSIVNGNAFVPMEPELEATSIKAYDVLVSQKGDFATFTFDVVNSGDIDARLESLSKLEPTCTSLALPAVVSDEELVCNNLEFKLTYTKNNKEVRINDIINAHSKENITMRVGVSNIDESLSDDVQITLYDMNLIYSHSN
ncbi:MAG: hypothetical protein IJ068_06530 [Bacilli bacterium]|nr:hypothetical protein [Bacilli bacterium]